MTRWLGALALVLLAAGVAWAQLVPGQGALVPRTGPPCGIGTALVPNCGPMVPNVAAVVVPPPSCTADGKTDWSNACDLPLLAAIGF